MYVRGQHYQPSLIFWSKAGVLLSLAPYCIPINKYTIICTPCRWKTSRVSLRCYTGLKKLHFTHTLAYFVATSCCFRASPFYLHFANAFLRLTKKKLFYLSKLGEKFVCLLLHLLYRWQGFKPVHSGNMALTKLLMIIFTHNI